MNQLRKEESHHRIAMNISRLTISAIRAGQAWVEVSVHILLCISGGSRFGHLLFLATVFNHS